MSAEINIKSNRRIGSIEFDADMAEAETYVQLCLDKTNKNLQNASRLYYMSRLYTYLETFKRTMENTKVHLDKVQAFKKYQKLAKKRLGYMYDRIKFQSSASDEQYFADEASKNQLAEERAKWKEFTDDIDRHVEETGAIFLSSKKTKMFELYYNNLHRTIKIIEELINKLEKTYNIYLVQKLFDFIANALCFSLHRFNPGLFDKYMDDMTTYELYRDLITDDIFSLYKYSDTIYSNNLFYLVNGVGLFGFNTYMYVYMNELSIIGVPDRYTDYDTNNNKCPGSFIRHDKNHIKDLLSSGRSFKNLYLTIVHDKETTLKQKELFILFLWFSIHEINERDNKLEFSFKNQPDIYEIIIHLFDDTKNAFGQNLRPYKNIYSENLTTEMIAPVIIGMSKLKPQSFSIYMDELIHDLESFPLSELLDDESDHDPDNVDLINILVAWLYIQNYFVTYYSSVLP